MVRDVTKPRALETEKRGLLSQEEQQGFPEEVVFKLSLEPSRDSRARTRSPSPRAQRPDFPGTAREVP